MLHFFAKKLKELHEVKRDERGFTLIELLVVDNVAISQMAVPSGSPAQLTSSNPSGCTKTVSLSVL
jgi:competence protein ComGC